MIKPTGRLGTTGSMRGLQKPMPAFRLEPHSQRQQQVSADYHGKTIEQLNPNRSLASARRFPQRGLGG